MTSLYAKSACLNLDGNLNSQETSLRLQRCFSRACYASSQIFREHYSGTHILCMRYRADCRAAKKLKGFRLSFCILSNNTTGPLAESSARVLVPTWGLCWLCLGLQDESTTGLNRARSVHSHAHAAEYMLMYWRFVARRSGFQ
jgi:hypothetical protein